MNEFIKLIAATAVATPLVFIKLDFIFSRHRHGEHTWKKIVQITQTLTIMLKFLSQRDYC